MDFGNTILSIRSFLKEHWVILVAVAAATALVKAATMLLANIACTRIIREIKGRGTTCSCMSPISIEGLKKIIEQEHHILSSILSRKYILEECFEKLKSEGVIVWSDELKAYCFNNRSGA